MGNGGGGIDWNPFHSTLGTAVSGNPNAAWEQVKSSLNPMDSTAGTLLKGNLGKAGQDIWSGTQNAAKASMDVLGAGLTGIPGAITNQQTAEIAQRTARDRQANEAGDAYKLAQSAEQNRQTDAFNAANQRNQDYQTQQANMAASLGAEDAFTKARNAARRAKGTQLFGGF